VTVIAIVRIFLWIAVAVLIIAGVVEGFREKKLTQLSGYAFLITVVATVIQILPSSGTSELSLPQGSVSISFASAPSSTTDTIVVADATAWGGHYYKLFDSGRDWNDAEAACHGLGGHLVAITSQDEQSFVQSMVQVGNSNTYWLGATNLSGKWRWTTGERWSYSNWASGQPDNYMSVEHYLEMYRLSNPYSPQSDALGKWNDVSVDDVIQDQSDFFSTSRIGYICEWDFGSK